MKARKMNKRVPLLSLLFCLIVSVASVSGQSSQKEKSNEAKPAASKSEMSDKDKAKAPKQIAKEDDIRKLLVATGAGKLGVQVMQQMLSAMRAQNPNIPSDYFDKLMEEVDPNELIEITIPSYDKHLTHDEIKELLKFYETPIGKKLVEKQPLIAQDSMIAGQKWGMELHRRLAERIENDF